MGHWALGIGHWALGIESRQGRQGRQGSNLKTYARNILSLRLEHSVGKQSQR
ncbi:hypothetical protein [Nostoc linckia]|uniref:hypothetical protein n=1 Tax=Nostoc linckia TaxID=92942 RepID=UPI0015D4DBCB|nr:hypothetical protein [Nostoc linckia]